MPICLVGEHLEAGAVRGVLGGDGDQLADGIGAEHGDALKGAVVGQPALTAAQIQQAGRGAVGNRLQDRPVGHPQAAEDLAPSHGPVQVVALTTQDARIWSSIHAADGSGSAAASLSASRGRSTGTQGEDG